jgi:phage terminase large subunit-like protein
MTQFADCIFNEDHFPTLGGNNKFTNDGQEIVWDDKTILSSNPRIKETELQVQKILELQEISSNLPDTFTDYKCVTKSLNIAINAPCRVEVPTKTTP